MCCLGGVPVVARLTRLGEQLTGIARIDMAGAIATFDRAFACGRHAVLFRLNGSPPGMHTARARQSNPPKSVKLPRAGQSAMQLVAQAATISRAQAAQQR